MASARAPGSSRGRRKPTTTTPGLSAGLVGGGRRADDGEDVGVGEDPAAVGSEGGSGFGVGLVGGSGSFAGTGFDGDGEALGDERLEVFRQQGDTRFAGCGLFEDAEDQITEGQGSPPR